MNARPKHAKPRHTNHTTPKRPPAGKPTSRAGTRPADPTIGWRTDIEGIHTFAELNLCEPIMRALAREGYDAPTPIQAVTIPSALSGRDILGCAQTGTGKTAAFALPIIHMLHAEGTASQADRAPRVLVLAPTRELAAQIAESFATYARGTGLRGTTVYGGVSQRKQELALQRGVDVLVATPGRLIDLLEQGVVDLSSVRYLAIDEADRMLDMGFIQPIRRIAGELTTDRQTMLFSATMQSKVMVLADQLLRDPVRVSAARTPEREPKIEQTLYRLGRNNDKQALLEALIAEHGVRCGVVFTKTKHGAERVGKRLRAAGIQADAIHGNKSQAQRQRALDSLRDGRSRVLVATDVAARGLDVDGVTHVFNFDLPIEPEAYVHRIGRTGRAGATGLAIAFCTPEERGLLRAIESMLGKPIPVKHELPELANATARDSVIDDDHDHASADADDSDRKQARRAQPTRRADRHADHPIDRDRRATPDAADESPALRIMRPTPNFQPRPGTRSNHTGRAGRDGHTTPGEQAMRAGTTPKRKRWGETATTSEPAPKPRGTGPSRTGKPGAPKSTRNSEIPQAGPTTKRAGTGKGAKPKPRSSQAR